MDRINRQGDRTDPFISSADFLRNKVEGDLTECPKCKEPALVRFVYGYPNRMEYLPGDIYGGDELAPQSPTHFCTHCKAAWLVEGLQQLFVPFPDNCYFCGDQLSDLDKFTYQNEYESWLEGDAAPFILEARTFKYDPLPTCEACRNSIHTTQEMSKNDDIIAGSRTWIVVSATCICIAIYAIVLLVHWFF